ncbi:MAG: endonuclease Q family protein [Promethearchaeota archaeon]
MQTFNADLHIHSPYSIAVSQNMNLDTIYETAKKKGLNILSTGDITQPAWRKYLQDNLEKRDGMYFYKDLSFIVGTELEDNESIHHVVLLPDFKAADKLQEILEPYVKNITGRWAGRPHVKKTPSEIVEIINDVGGICGPAHAFTPFKSIFRQGRYKSLEDAYKGAEKKIAFLELGLSADTNLADRMKSLQDITFLSNSDAHSEGAQSLGREFNRMELESPSFDEIKKAFFRRKDRRVVLNVGLEPRLGKYFIMFCNKCRRRIRYGIQDLETAQNSTLLQSGWKPYKIDHNFIYYNFKNKNEQKDFLKLCSKGEIICKACQSEIKEKQKLNKKIKKVSIPKLRLGVSERVNEIATWDKPKHPEHRPPYLDIIPLVEIIRKIRGVKNSKAKSVLKMYDEIIGIFGSEYEILIDLPIEKLQNFQEKKLAEIILAFRESKIKYIPGGGGIFGEISLDEI